MLLLAEVDTHPAAEAQCDQLQCSHECLREDASVAAARLCFGFLVVVVVVAVPSCWCWCCCFFVVFLHPCGPHSGIVFVWH